jgi:hypothetical protein
MKIYKRGSMVTFEIGGLLGHGKIVSDLGNIGLHGRRLLRVEVEVGEGAEPFRFNLPATDVRE